MNEARETVSPGPRSVRAVRVLELEGPRGIRLRCRVPERRRERTHGLLGRNAIESDEALLLPNATSVHTFGMRIAILVARLDRSLRVVEVRLVPPWRLLLPTRGAQHVLEGSVELDLRVGDDLRAGGMRGSSSLQETSERERQGGYNREGKEGKGNEATGPGRERDRLSPAAVRPDDAEELQ